MRTELAQVDPDNPDPLIIERAANLILAGEVVAFPTETVYGLGANALNPTAVEKIFAAKGRPSFNPLIVHVLDEFSAIQLCTEWPTPAHLLVHAFWPGPLSIVLPKLDLVPSITTGGLQTVALRSPSNAVARELLVATKVPIAAPSANRSTLLSPTTAQHVASQLDGIVPLVLDAGQTTGGIESTILDLTAEYPRILRPGPVTPTDIEAVIGVAPELPRGPVEQITAPGMMEVHYAPRTRLRILKPDESPPPSSGAMLLGKSPCGAQHIQMPNEPAEYARLLYATLHKLDQAVVPEIVVEFPPDTPAWSAIRDRLRRASGKQV